LKFGTLETTTSSMLDLPAAVCIGLVCGLIGTSFIWVNINLGIYRKKYINTNMKKIFEAIFFAFTTSSCFFLGVLCTKNDCVKITDMAQAEDNGVMRFICEEGEYNVLASLVFNTEGGIIRTLLRLPIKVQEDIDNDNINVLTIIIFMGLWILFTFTTYGVWVPAGLFLPGIIIGSCIGLLYLQLMIWCGMEIYQVGGQSYIIMGASAMLAGYCRLTYSLAVIMLETTQSINLFLPIIFTILSSFGVARIFNRSLYDYALRGKQMPILKNHAPKQTMYLHAKDFMTPEPIIVEGISTVERLAEVLNTPFNVFPVLNMAGNVMGMIPKNFLIVLIERLHWYDLKGETNVKTRYTSHYKK
jgi:chloride channel 7